MPGPFTTFSAEHSEYLRDESRRVGNADSISFPKTEAEVAEAVRFARETGVPITVQGARTGIVAGAVPQGGHVINLSRMNGIGEICDNRLRVQPGAALSEIRKVVDAAGLFFPPDPTETSASIGGMAACNASGARSFHYGPTRNWIHSLRVELGDGDVLSLARGECAARGRSFALRTAGGREIAGELPGYRMPSVKSAAGYYAADDMDMTDLFIGMEGTLGIVTEVELVLIPAPSAVAGLTVFLPSEEAALRFVRILTENQHPVAIEFFDADSLNLLRKMKEDRSAFADVPALKPHFHTAVYAEFHGESDDTLEEAVMALMEDMADLGASDEEAWFATSEREMSPLKAFRHALPEAVNLLIDERRQTCPTLTKLGTDMSVPGSELESMMAMYRDDLHREGLESVIFGHIGNNHTHVNILPNSMEEYERGRSLYLNWAERVVSVGGSVSAEHGIGKLKTPFLKLMYGTDGIEQMRALKRLFDPEMLLNRGNLFP